MGNTARTRNYALDILKLFASFMVVFIHVPFYGEVGTVVKAIARFAVPVFFISSGYFCYKNDAVRIKKKMLRIVGILAFTSVLYNAMNFGLAFLSDGTAGLKEELSVFLDVSRWVDLIVFNRPFSATRLWFLFALVYVYALQIFLQKINVSEKTVAVISVGGLVLNIILTEGLSLFGTVLPDHFARNFLLTGYPFFGIGMLLRSNKEKVVKTKTSLCIALCVAGVVLTVVSNIFVKFASLYAGSVVVAVAVFVLAMKCEGVTYPKALVKVAECNLGIYIFHRPVAVVTGKVLEAVGLADGTVAYMTAQPFLVCAATTVLTLVLLEIQSRIKAGKTKEKA